MRLPWPLQAQLEAAARALLMPPGLPGVDFTQPHGEPALVAPDSISWRVFKNPVTLMIGGIAAVILELAEPRVRTGVWEHSGFRGDPVLRLRRTGLAAMVTVYGARSVAERMIAGVGRMHGLVEGITPNGQLYRADDPELLNWVYATASFGFLEAYHTYVMPLSAADRDRYYKEALTAARLYGAAGAPSSDAQRKAMFATMLPRLEPSPIVFRFLDIMRSSRILPSGFQVLQPLLIAAAVNLVPQPVRDILGLNAGFDMGFAGSATVRSTAAVADLLILEASPGVQACRRLGLPSDYLYR